MPWHLSVFCQNTNLSSKKHRVFQVHKGSMKHTHGSIEVICGSMFSGKTDELIRRLVRATIAKQKVEVFKPAIDIRYAVEKVTSHAGSDYDAIPVQKAVEIREKIGPDITVVGID